MCIRDSANAVAITLYLVASRSAQAPAVGPAVAEDPQASRREVDGLRRYWLETLERFAYFRRTERERFEPLFRRFVDRLRLSRHDLNVLRGILAQMNRHVWNDRFDGKEGDSATRSSIDKPLSPTDLEHRR